MADSPGERVLREVLEERQDELGLSDEGVENLQRDLMDFLLEEEERSRPN